MTKNYSETGLYNVGTSTDGDIIMGGMEERGTMNEYWRDDCDQHPHLSMNKLSINIHTGDRERSKSKPGK